MSDTVNVNTENSGLGWALYFEYNTAPNDDSRAFVSTGILRIDFGR